MNDRTEAGAVSSRPIDHFDEIGHYECPPLVAGGQGSDGEAVTHTAVWLFAMAIAFIAGLAIGSYTGSVAPFWMGMVCAFFGFIAGRASQHERAHTDDRQDIIVCDTVGRRSLRLFVHATSAGYQAEYEDFYYPVFYDGDEACIDILQRGSRTLTEAVRP